MSGKWNRIVTIVSRDKVSVLGQITDDDSLSSIMYFDRVNVDNVSEVELDCENNANHLDGSVVTGVGLIGLLPLQGATYLGIITKSTIAGYVGDHTVWSISDVEWLPLNFGINSPSTIDQRHLALVSNLFRTSDFYFSYTYNMCCSASGRFNDNFKWNSYHTKFLQARNISSTWDLDILCGSFRSVDFHSLGRLFSFSLICRRSRRYAGTRYRKRGINQDGFCANEIESEQILISYGPPHQICSFMQVRGSVPLHWSQASHGLVPKPEIIVHYRDLNLESTKKHFQDLISRYGVMIKAVSLLAKGHHRSSESTLGAEYSKAIDYTKDFLGEETVSLDEFDLKGASVGDSGSTTPNAEPLHSSMYSEARQLAGILVRECGWTSSGDARTDKTQKGIIRTNCVDCLDRTNIFQYIVGLEVLTEQLRELGVMNEPLRPSWVSGNSARGSPVLAPDRNQSDPSLIRLIEEIFDLCGDQLSYQYAGTATHKKYASDSAPGTSGGPRGKRGFLNEIFISLGRHYSSSFTDTDKQNALNLFLGMYAEVMHEVAVYEDVCSIENVDRWVHSQSRDGGEHGQTRIENSPIVTRSKPKYKSLNAQRLNNVRHISFT